MSGSPEKKTQGILEILAALSARGLTGRLRVDIDAEAGQSIEFLFRNGHLLFATSSRSGERLGEFLVRRGILSSNNAKHALLEAQLQGRFFHSYLVDEGIVARERIPDLLYQRAEELLDTILNAEGGRVIFEPLEPHAFDDEAPVVDEELFGRLLRHRNVWPQVYNKFKDPGLVLRKVADCETNPAYAAVSEAERKVLGLLNGERLASEILERRKNRIDLMILMARFLETGLAIVVQNPAAVARATSISAQPAAGFSFDFSMVPVPVKGADLAQMSLTGLLLDDLTLIGQINGRSTIRELIGLSGLPEHRVGKALERLVARGYVTLHTRFSPPSTPA